MPGKNSKQTKKFVKTKLKGTLERRRNSKKIRKPSFQKGNKSTNHQEQDVSLHHDEDEEVDFGRAFNRKEKPQLVSLSQKEKGYVEESDEEEEENGEESEEESDDESDQEDSDEEVDGGEEGDDETVSNTNKTLAEEVEEHKNELEILKANDPEFYKYLKSNDKKLLEFGADDEFDDLEEDDVEDDEEEGEKKEGEEEEEGDDDDDDQGVGDDNEGEKRAGKAKKKVITAEMLDTWERLALTETHYRAVWRLVMTFRTACHISDDADRFRKDDKFTINSSQIFNRVMVFSLKHIPKLFDRLLGNSLVVAHGQGGEKEGEKEENKLKKVMTRSNEWSKVKKAVSAFLQNLIHFLRQLANKEMISFVLRKTTQALLPYFGAYPTIAHRYLKTLLRFWTNEDPEVRTLAYANIRGLALAVPFPFLDSCLKGIYLTYVKNSKFVTPTNLPLIEFMCDSVVDLYSLDFLSSYQHAFVYIRQLAIHLRNSLSVKSKDAFRQVYNWQFINSVRVFAQLLSQYGSQSDLRHLVYPLIQITLGTVRLIPTSRYYPLRFLLIRFLNQLAQHNDNLFVPVVPYLLEIFECSDLHRKPRPAPSTIRPIQFDVAIKISKSVLGTRVFQDGVIDQVLELLLQHFATHAYSISFPELIVPAVIQLKRYAKKCTIPPLKKQVLQLVDKLNNNTTFILGLRQRVDFSPKDLKSVATFAAAEKSKGKSPLETYYNQVVAGRKASEKNRRLYDDSGEVSDSGDEGNDGDEEEEDNNDEDDDDEGDNKKRKQKKDSKKGGQDKKHTKKGGKQEQKKRDRDHQQSGGPSKKRGRFDADVVKDFNLDEDD